jgi:hypothetical protein
MVAGGVGVEHHDVRRALPVNVVAPRRVGVGAGEVVILVVLER